MHNKTHNVCVYFFSVFFSLYFLCVNGQFFARAYFRRLYGFVRCCCTKRLRRAKRSSSSWEGKQKTTRTTHQVNRVASTTSYSAVMKVRKNTKVVVTVHSCNVCARARDATLEPSGRRRRRRRRHCCCCCCFSLFRFVVVVSSQSITSYFHLLEQVLCVGATVADAIVWVNACANAQPSSLRCVSTYMSASAQHMYLIWIRIISTTTT